MQSFASSTLSLPAGAEKKSKRNILRRLSLGKPKAAASTSSLASSSTAHLASRSTATLAVPPSEECASRRAFDLFSSGPSRPIIDAYASMPSTPRMPKTPTHGSHSSSAKVSSDTRSTNMARSKSATSAAARASTNSSRSKTDDTPPVPPVPKLYLISDEVFIIAAPPAARSSASRVSESSTDSTGMATSTTGSSTSTSLSSPMLSSRSSNSCRSSGSWLDNLGSPSEEDTPVFPGLEEEPPVAPATSSARSRSSLDEIDDQMLLNLCEVAMQKTPAKAAATEAEGRSTRSESGHSTPTPTSAARARPARSHARSASQQVVPPVPAMPASYKRVSHVRSGSAPLSLGPLPPQPTEPPTEAVLRKTDQIKKRYSRQGSPLISSSPVLGGSPEISAAAFIAPRPAPGTPKLDRVSSLRSLESALSVDSKKASRNHKRSVSKSSGRSFESSFALPKEVKLTPGHVATPTQETPQPELEMELVSRFSEDSDAGSDDPRRLLALLSPVLGSVSRMTGFASSSDAGASTDDSRRHSRISGSKTPEMVARSSSSSSSSYSDLSELTPSVVDDTVFDLSRKSLDYRTVYALAQEYAKSSSSVTTTNSTSRKKLPAAKSQPTGFSLWNRQQNKLPDPIDRSYHLRKY